MQRHRASTNEAATEHASTSACDTATDTRPHEHSLLPKPVGYYQYDFDNTPGCYLTNITIAIVNVVVLLRSLQKGSGLEGKDPLCVKILQLHYVLEAITHLLSALYHRVDANLPNPSPHSWLTVKIFNSLARGALVLSLVCWPAQSPWARAVAVTACGGLSWYAARLSDKGQVVLTLMKFVATLAAALRAERPVLMAAGYGFCQEALYIAYRFRYPKCTSDEEYDAPLSKSFNHNAIYHLNTAVFNWCLYSAIAGSSLFLSSS